MAITAIEAVMYTSRVPVPPDVSKEQSIKDVRNRLASVITAVRFFDRVIYMTNRRVRVAAVVPVELGELAEELGGPTVLIDLVHKARQSQG